MPKTWIFLIPMIVLMIPVAVGCDDEDSPSQNVISKSLSENSKTLPKSSPAGFPYTIKSSDGKPVIFETPPQRIVAMDSSAVEILFAIGEGHRIVGTHDFVTYPPETKNIKNLGDAFNLNIEETLALKPDLVFVFSDNLVEILRRMKVKVLYLENLQSDFTNITDNIRMWGQITGAVLKADKVATEFETHLTNIEAAMANRTKGPRVFQDEGELWTPGPNTLIHEVFDLLKLENIASDVNGYAQLSPEIIVERDPQIIIASYSDQISGNPTFKNVTAVINRRVYVPNGDALSIAGPRYVKGIEQLAIWIYPDLFE